MTGKGCTFCTRQGLPVLPVRPALMVKDEILPRLPDNIEMPVPAQGETAYTTRLLREGFLYIYDEMVNGWIDYYVTSEGYYYPLPVKGPVPPDLAAGKVKPCANHPSELARASLITLPVMPSGKKNGTFWFGWSQVPWTEATRKKHEEAGYRARYMQRFDMEQWLRSAEGEQVIKLTRLKTIVAEYADSAASSHIKAYSDAPWKEANAAAANTLLDEAQTLMPERGVMIFLPDPTAMLQDISRLSAWRLDKDIYQHPEHARKIALLSSITVLKKTLKEQFAREMVLESENYETLERQAYSYNVPGDIRADISAKKSDETLNARVEEKWAAYEKYYDPEKVSSYQKEFQSLLEPYNERIITPMTEMYLSWIKGEHVHGYFLHNFDTESVASGIDYVETLSQCVMGMQDKIGTQIYFRDMLLGDPNDTTNIIARALNLNQQTLIQATDKALKNSPDWANIQWNALADTWKTELDLAAEGAASVVGRLLALLTGPLVGAIDRALSSHTLFHALVSVGALSNKAIVTFEKEALRKDFVAQVVRQLAIEGGVHTRSAKDSLRHYVDRELRRLRIDGLPLEGKETKLFIVMLDTDKIPAIQALPAQQQSKALAKIIRTTASVEAEQFTHWQSSVARGIQNARQAFPFLLGIASVVMQTYALYKSADYKSKTLTPNQTEAQHRFAGNVAAAFSTLFGVVESGLKKINWLGATPSLAKKIAYGSVELVGKALGVIGGVVAAYYDLFHAIDETLKGPGHSGLAVAFWVQTIADITLTIACLTTIPVIGIALAVITLLITSIYILLNSQTKIQEWLCSCLWRSVPDDMPKEKWPPIWPSMEVEMSELKLALEQGE